MVQLCAPGKTDPGEPPHSSASGQGHLHRQGTLGGGGGGRGRSGGGGWREVAEPEENVRFIKHVSVARHCLLKDVLC